MFFEDWTKVYFFFTKDVISLLPILNNFWRLFVHLVLKRFTQFWHHQFARNNRVAVDFGVAPLPGLFLRRHRHEVMEQIADVISGKDGWQNRSNVNPSISGYGCHVDGGNNLWTLFRLSISRTKISAIRISIHPKYIILAHYWAKMLKIESLVKNLTWRNNSPSKVPDRPQTVSRSKSLRKQFGGRKDCP